MQLGENWEFSSIYPKFTALIDTKSTSSICSDFFLEFPYMQIRSISLQRLQIPLRTQFSQANNSTAFSDSIMLKLETSKGIVGVGESCPRPYVTGEDPQTVQRDVNRLEKEILQRRFESVPDIREYVLHDLLQKIGPAASCAIELALLDAWGKENRTYVLELLGGSFLEEYTYSCVLPMAEEEATRNILHQFHAIGFVEIKLKIGRDLQANVNRMSLVRQIMGSDTTIRLDVNCAWDLPIARRQMPKLIEAGATNFEQMFESDQLDAFQQITEEFGSQTRIAIDEGLNTPESAQRMIDRRICNQFNLKISKHGGLFGTLEVCRLAKENGIGLQLGAHFGETSILTSAGLVIASLVPELSSLEGAFGTHLLEYDITDTPLQFGHGGRITKAKTRMNHYGLGVSFNESLSKSTS